MSDAKHLIGIVRNPPYLTSQCFLYKRKPTGTCIMWSFVDGDNLQRISIFSGAINPSSFVLSWYDVSLDPACRSVSEGFHFLYYYVILLCVVRRTKL